MKYQNRPQSSNIEDRRREHKNDNRKDVIVNYIEKVDAYAANYSRQRKQSIEKNLTRKADSIMRGIDPKVMDNKRNKRRDSLND